MVEGMYAEARLPIIIFGDGLQAQLLKITEGHEDVDGVAVVECRIRPTKELAYFMGITEEMLDQRDRSIIAKYPKEKVIPLNNDPTTATVIILCDYKGRDTRLTELYVHLLNAIEGKEKITKSLRGENAWLHEQMKRITSQEEKHTQDVVRKITPYLRLRGDIPPGDSGGSNDVEYQGP